MIFSRSIHTVIVAFFILFLVLTITACGGGASSTNAEPNHAQPIEITKNNWKNNNLRAKQNDSNLLVEDLGDRLKIVISYDDFVSAINTQIFIDADNNKQTGFSFENQAWGLIGADYLIENGSIYKSLSSGSDWAWSQNALSLESYSKLPNSIEIIITKNELSNPCTTINLGMMGRDASWNIDIMHPVSNNLATASIQACSNTGTDTIKPIITLSGSNQMSIVKDTQFQDPGAIATDNIDGNISSSIVVSSTVNTSHVGTYKLTYSVTDSAGNTASADRTVKVINAPTSNGISVDGSSQDWDSLTSSSYTKLTQTLNKKFFATQDLQKQNIYLFMQWSLLSSDNHVQVYLDTDNDINTGYQIWDKSVGAVISGAEYVIENGSLNKYTGTDGYEWSWHDNVHPIEYIHNNNIVEIQFPSSIITTKNVDLMVYRVNSSWSDFQLFANNKVYSTNGLIVKKFSHVKMHNELLNTQSIIFGERGSFSDTVQDLNITAPVNKGGSSLKVSSTAELMVNQLIVYQTTSNDYYIAQIKSMPNDTTINLNKPLEGSIATGIKAWNFYANDSHPNQYGYRAIADYMVQSQNMGSNSTGRHVLFGDSWFDQPHYLESRLAQKLPLITIINEGIGGNTTKDLVNRFDSDVTPNNPDVIWVIAGTNDYWQGVLTSEYKANIQILIDKSKAINAKLKIIDSSVGAGTGATGIDNYKQSADYVNALIELY